MAIIETVETKHDDELDSRVELTETGMTVLQLLVIEDSLKQVRGTTLTYDATADGWTAHVVSGRQSFEVHGTGIVDVLAQACQVIKLEEDGAL